MSLARAKGRIGLIIPPVDGLEPRECALLYPQIEFVTVGLGIKEMSPQGFIDVSGRLISVRATTTIALLVNPTNPNQLLHLLTAACGTKCESRFVPPMAALE